MAILKLSTTSANASVGALGARHNGGAVRIYSGSMPASGDTAPTGTLLATFVLQNPAYGAAAAGVITAAAVPIAGTINAAGTAGYAALVTSGGTVTEYIDVGLALSGAYAILSTLAIPASGTVTLNSLTFTQSPS